ncbi:MAG: hypothetical protein JSR66_30515 [Proteobacteria bacterium]|nr:hypothetical protein [Pseudomonadota bacterium]
MKPDTREQHIPHDSEKPLPSKSSPGGRKAGTTQPGIADEDKRVRSGNVDEPVRNTPPAGSWNDVASNE